MHRFRGFTLLDLLVTLAVASLLLVLAVPAFSSLVRHGRLVAITNDLFSALYLARSEAVRRGTPVALCKSADQESCTAEGGYDQGWIVFEDSDGNAQREPDEPIIQVRHLISRASITGNLPVARYVSYSPLGATRASSGALQMGTLTVCSVPDARKIVISRTGRPRVERTECEG